MPDLDPSLEGLPQATDVYFDHHKNAYWTTDAYGRWIRYTRDSIRLRLRNILMLSASPRDGLPAEVDVELDRISQEQSVDAVLPLAGYYAGVHDVLGARFLVPASPDPLLPGEGDHEPFVRRLERLFGDKSEYVISWWSHALKDVYEFWATRKGRNVGQAIAVAGPSGLGKSLWAKLVTESLGRRKANPAQYVVGKTSFNEDLMASEVLLLDDEGLDDSYHARKTMGDVIKQVVAVDQQRVHPKGRAAFAVICYQRMIICLNDEAENLQVLPPLERGVMDKLMLVKAVGSLLNEQEQGRKRSEVWDVLMGELPAFLHWLAEDYETPDEISDARFGTTAWHDEELAQGVDEFSPELKLLHLISERTDLYKDGRWIGTARELEVLLKFAGTPTEREAHDLLKSSGSVGKYLAKLAQKRPERVSKMPRIGGGGVRQYRVKQLTPVSDASDTP